MSPWSERRKWLVASAAALVGVPLTCVPLPALAVDLSMSGFATLGYARSDRPYRYQRFIDDDGTLRRDSVAGLQIDAKATPEFAATLQVKAAPATDSDHRYEASIAWAFVSWRPDNDWLFRLGKQRIPLYLYSETVDVGATYEFARLPTEMYSIVPSNDFIGISFSKSFRLGDGDLLLDGYLGRSSSQYRVWVRDGLASIQAPGAAFVPVKLPGAGLVVSLRTDESVFRIGVLRARIEQRNGEPLASSYPFVNLAPEVGYYQVSDRIPGPGVPAVDGFINTTMTAGVSLSLPTHFRLTAEIASSRAPRSDIAPKGTRGYLALQRAWGAWTPYATWAFLRSPAQDRYFYDKVNSNRVPDPFAGASALNASQRFGADGIGVYDQTSIAIGTSYAFSATSKLKAEIMRTRIGDVSKLVDAPPGGDVRHQSITVLSLSYSVVF